MNYTKKTSYKIMHSLQNTGKEKVKLTVCKLHYHKCRECPLNAFFFFCKIIAKVTLFLLVGINY